MKKLLSIMIIFTMFLMISSPALARKSGGFSGGFSKPKTTTTNKAPSTTKDSTSSSTNTTNTESTNSGDKIPYTNLKSSKTTTVSGTVGTAPTVGRSNLSGFRPSFSPFSGNFWMWMFLMNSFGHNQPAVAQTQGSGEETKATGGEVEQTNLYTPSVSDYWSADPLANTISTIILLAVIAIPIMLILKRRKKKYSY